MPLAPPSIGRCALELRQAPIKVDSGVPPPELFRLLTATVAQSVRAPDCGSGCRGFDSRRSPHPSLLQNFLLRPLGFGGHVGWHAILRRRRIMPSESLPWHRAPAAEVSADRADGTVNAGSWQPGVKTGLAPHSATPSKKHQTTGETRHPGLPPPAARFISAASCSVFGF